MLTLFVQVLQRESSNNLDIINDYIISLHTLIQLKKPDAQDPMHKWIGTYNLYLMCIKKFFKWVISRDLSARPHEILGLKLKDIVFKSVGSKQYAEVIVNGKTGARHLPLIDSLPYIKEWSDQHPQRNNPEAYFICSHDRKAFAKQMSLKGLQYIYKQYSKKYFPRLLNDPTISKEDKRKIEDLLKKPWNLYIQCALSAWNTTVKTQYELELPLVYH